MKSSTAPLLTQDIKADLVNISIEMRHVRNAGKIVRHILCHDAGDARTDTGRRQILKAFRRSLKGRAAVFSPARAVHEILASVAGNADPHSMPVEPCTYILGEE
ncbi:Uncharacterised protein [Chlamydia trachomatis]|nr:Uncharacterised protein [Chlamydia trachomatis]